MQSAAGRGLRELPCSAAIAVLHDGDLLLLDQNSEDAEDFIDEIPHREHGLFLSRLTGFRPRQQQQAIDGFIQPCRLLENVGQRVSVLLCDSGSRSRATSLMVRMEASGVRSSWAASAVKRLIC